MTAKQRRMLVIGLTGSIGMGKSTAAVLLRKLGLPVHNSDRAVHNLLRKGGKAVKPVARFFPQALKHGAIDRKILGQSVFGHPRKLRQLEKILHPLVRKSQKNFLVKARKQKLKAAVLEIPLLFETKAEKRCDAVLCVMAPKTLQKKRVMQRPGMTAARFKAIVKQQMPDGEKRRRADYIIDTGKSVADTKKQLTAVLDKLLSTRV